MKLNGFKFMNFKCDWFTNFWGMRKRKHPLGMVPLGYLKTYALVRGLPFSRSPLLPYFLSLPLPDTKEPTPRHTSVCVLFLSHETIVRAYEVVSVKLLFKKKSARLDTTFIINLILFKVKGTDGSLSLHFG